MEHDIQPRADSHFFHFIFIFSLTLPLLCPSFCLLCLLVFFSIFFWYAKVPSSIAAALTNIERQRTSDATKPASLSGLPKKKKQTNKTKNTIGKADITFFLIALNHTALSEFCQTKPKRVNL